MSDSSIRPANHPEPVEIGNYTAAAETHSVDAKVEFIQIAQKDVLDARPRPFEAASQQFAIPQECVELRDGGDAGRLQIQIPT